MTQGATDKVNSYIKTLAPWQKKILTMLREIIHRADPEITEDWKWDKPAFSHNGLVCWIWAFKQWVSFTLYRGSLIPDTYKLYNHGSFMDRNRTIAFTDVSEIQEKPLIEYIRQAVANNLAGNKVRIKPRDDRSALPPPELEEILSRHGLKERFDERPPYQRRDYIAWIISAKLPATREKRSRQMVEELRDGNAYMGMPWNPKKYTPG